jgi:hypothetical protein
MKGRNPQRAVLLIADISGYTRFMTKTRMSLAHAQVIITELMKALIDEVKLPLQIAEVEGDAVFVIGLEEQGDHSWERVCFATSQKIFQFFEVFRRRLQEILSSNMCRCSACDGADRLKLKMVLHVGKVVFFSVDPFYKPSGPDVILAHKLLKNSISLDEYLLMTEEAYSHLSKYRNVSVQRGVETYEEIGNVNVLVWNPAVCRGGAGDLEARRLDISLFGKLRQTMRIVMDGMLVAVGLKRVRRFRHLSRT